MSKKRILDISPYTFMETKREVVKDENDQPIVFGVEKNPETGEEKPRYMFRTVDVKSEYTTDEIKRDIAYFLGNSGNPQNQKFRIEGREKWKRNKLADRIEESETDKVELTNNDYKMLESTFDEMGGHVPRVHRTLLDRVFEAPEKEDKED